MDNPNRIIVTGSNVERSVCVICRMENRPVTVSVPIFRIVRIMYPTDMSIPKYPPMDGPVEAGGIISSNILVEDDDYEEYDQEFSPNKPFGVLVVPVVVAVMESSSASVVKEVP